MKTTLKIILTAFLAILLPRFIFEVCYVFLFENCDPKFGCNGTFTLEMMLLVVFGMISVLSLASLLLIIKKVHSAWQVIMASFFLTFAYEIFLSLSFFSSMLEMVLAWFVLSLMVYLLAITVTRRKLYPISSK